METTSQPARSERIAKPVAMLKVSAWLDDWERTYRQFDWRNLCLELGSAADEKFNIADLAVDRHAQGMRADHVALRWLGRFGKEKAFTYAQLSALSNRCANVLKNCGVDKGDRVFVLAPRIPELYIAVLGALKIGAVVSPLFSAFGPEPIATRINLGSGKVLVTTESLYTRKVQKIRDSLASLEHVLLAGEEGNATQVPGALDFAKLMAQSSEMFSIEPTTKEDPALLHFTSGTTGTPKGAIHVHGAALMHYMTGKFALDLHPYDVFWCTADPGWVTGTSYGIIAPLLHGVTSIIDESEFDAERWYRILQEQHVSVWYTAPTAIRMLMKAGDDIPKKYHFEKLRFVASVGEPLNPEAVWWGKEILGLPIHDNWWQTETGGIMIANFPAMDIKPGSMGKPLPGVEALIVEHGEGGAIKIIEQPNVQGELALRAGWPSMFRGYLNQEERYRKCFAGDLYLTGDLVSNCVN